MQRATLITATFGSWVVGMMWCACSSSDPASTGTTAATGDQGGQGATTVAAGGKTSITTGSNEGTGGTTLLGEGGKGGSPTVEVPTGTPYVYIGTYGQSIHSYKLDLTDGSFALASEPVAAGDSPAFLAVNSERTLLFAANESYNSEGGRVTSFRIDAANGHLTKGTSVATGASGTVHVSVPPRGNYVLAANYGNGQVDSHGVGVFSFDVDGTLRSPAVSEVAGGKNPHMVVVAPSGKFALVPAKGSEVLLRYAFDEADGKLSGEVELPAAAGPRHVAFHPNGKFVYLVNELAGTIQIYPADELGVGPPLNADVLTLADGIQANQNRSAEIQVAPSGQFLYVSNRSDNNAPEDKRTDEIVVYSINESTGILTFVDRTKTGGREPRHFSIEASGKWLVVANQKSKAVRSFRIDTGTGKLSEGKEITLDEEPTYAGVTYLP